MKNNFSRAVALFIAMIMLITVFTGCGAQKQEEKTVTDSTAVATKAEEKEAVKLELLANKDHWTAGNQAVVDAFKVKTGVNLEVEVLPGGTDSDNVMKVRLATGQAPDIMTWMSGAMMSTMSPDKNFEDISKEPFMANVDESFKAGTTVNGKVLAVPLTPSQFGVWFYNKKVYTELGLQVPKTWAELMSNCEKIKTSGKTPIVAPYKDAWTTQLIVLADYYNVKKAVPTLSADITANKVKLQDTKEYIRSWEKLQEVFNKGYIGKDSLSMTYDEGIKALCEGTGVQFPMGSWVLDAISDKYPDKANDIGAFVQPADDASVNGMTLWLPWGLFITQQSDEKETAKKFLEFYISKEGCDAFASKQKPAGPFLIKGISLPDDILPSVKDVAGYIDSGNSYPALEFECPLVANGFDKITQEVAAGFISPIDGVKKTDTEYEKYAKSNNLPGW